MITMFYAFTLLPYFLFFSFLATRQQIQLWPFWIGTLASLIPWAISLVVLSMIASLLPVQNQQSAGMAGIIPVLCALASAIVCPIISLFLHNELTSWSRFKWFFVGSFCPAIIVLIYLVFTFGYDKLKG